MASAWEDARGGSTRVTLILGEPGSGKTRLTEEFAGRFAEVKPLTGRCFDYATAPYAPVAELFRELAQRDRAVLNRRADLRVALDALFASDHVAGPEIAKRTAFDAAADVLRLYAARRPLLLVVEDVHWSDLASLELILHLGMVATGLRLMLVVTARERELAARHEAIDTVARIERLPAADVIRLGRLGTLETKALIAHEAALCDRVLDAPAQSAIAAAANGNPLYLRELTRHYAADPGAAQRRQLPVSLRAAVTARVRELSELEQSLLRAASAAIEFDEELVAAVTSAPPSDVAAALRRATGMGLLTSNHAGGLTFDHELIRLAVYEELLPGERRSLHARIGAHLAAPDREPAAVARLALHAWAAGNRDDAVRYSELAGDSAFARFAFEDAAEHYRRAVESRADPDFPLLDKYAKALERGARLLAARAVLRRCLEHPHGREDAAARADLWIRIARAELADTNRAAAVAAVDEARRLLHAVSPSALHFTAHLFRAWLLWHDDDADGAFAALADAEPYRHLAEPRFVARSHEVAALAYALRGDVTRWRENEERMLAAAERTGDDFEVATALFDFASSALRLGETALSVTLGERACEIAGRRGWLQSIPYSLAGHAAACLAAGELRRARTLVERALLNSAEYPGAELMARCVGAIVAVRVDDAELLQRSFPEDAVVERALGGETWLLVAVAHAVTLKLASEGKPDVVRRFLRRVVAALGPLRADISEVLVFVAEWGLHGEFPHCLTLVDADATRSRAACGYPHLYRALIARGAAERIGHARAAAAAFRGIGYRLYEAWACELAGDTAQARELYDACGAAREVRRIDAAAAPAPAEFGAAGESLTPREAQIAALTVRGLSNREIAETLSLSERTIETHLGAVFAKLGVRSRVELTLRQTTFPPIGYAAGNTVTESQTKRRVGAAQGRT